MSEDGYFGDADRTQTRAIGLINLRDDFPLAVAKRRTDRTYDSLRTHWLPQFRAGGIRAVVGAVYTPSAYLPEAALRHAMRVIDALHEELAENQDAVELARSAPDVERINKAGRIAVVLALEGAEPLGQDLAVLRLFHRLGVRMLSFTWQRRTAFGDGAWENNSRGGLTRLGRHAVKEMNRLGMVVDVSHASDRTTWDILEASTKPVIASHSNARALCDHPRNLTDEMIRAIAAADGVVGATAVARFITDGTATIGHWADHLEHVIRLAGIDHVGIGTDFDNHLSEIGASPEIADWSPETDTKRYRCEGMLSAEDLPGLTRELTRRGLAECELRKIYYENCLRLFSSVLG
jgi:membrane dipeptidase